MKKTLLTLSLIATLGLTACNSDNPKNFKVTKMTEQQSAVLQKSLTTEEYKLVLGYLMRKDADETKADLSKVTVGQAIDDERAFKTKRIADKKVNN